MIEWIALGGLAVWAATSQGAATQQLDDISTIDGDAMVTFGAGVVLFAKSIGRQEGFGVPGARPTRNHNPGNLTGRMWTGRVDAQGFAVFASDADGWDALYRQLQLIANGRSHVYTPQMTIAQMAAKYSPKPDPMTWADNVSAFSGFTPETTLDTVFA